MNEIQEQVEQLIDDMMMGRPINHREFKNLLRQVVEECLTIDGAALFILAVQHIKKKRESFAWLEGE